MEEKRCNVVSDRQALILGKEGWDRKGNEQAVQTKDRSR